MPAIKVRINVEVDGTPLPGFPLVRRLEPVKKDVYDGNIPYYSAFVPIPQTGNVTQTQVLFLQPIGGQLLFRLVNNEDPAISVNTGGFILVLDSTGFTGTTVQNTTGSQVRLRVINLGS
jgi:hypothetical protein